MVKMPRTWTQVGDGLEMTAAGTTYRAARGGAGKFFIASAGDELIGQAPTLSGAQALCESAAARCEASP